MDDRDARIEDAWRLALEEARTAAAEDEVPVGAVVFRSDDVRVLASDHDRKMAASDPTAHAEMLAMRWAAGALGDWRLAGCTLLVTLEPCAMCAGAILLARLDAVFFAAASPKFGALGSKCDILAATEWNHRPEVGRAPAWVAEESSAILTAYFRSHRRRDDGAPPGI